MFDIFLTVLPVFLVLGTGYAAVRFGYLPVSIADALNSFAVKIAVPVLLFRAMLGLDFSAAFHPPMLLGFYAGAVTAFVAGIFIARAFFDRRPGEAVAVGFTAMFSNTVLLGIPITERAFGPETLTPALGIISLHAPMLYALGMVTMELSRRDGRPIGMTLIAAGKSILANALMLGILAGAILNLSRVTLPEPAMAAITMIANAAIPAALVGIGAALTRYRLKAEFAESAAVSFLTLVLHPAIAFAITHYLLALPGDYVRAATVIAAMPPGMNVYVFAVMYQRAVALAASTLLIGTAASVLTITAWLALLERVL